MYFLQCTYSYSFDGIVLEVIKRCLICTAVLQDNLSFPLIFPDWNADEEILLLEVDFVILHQSCIFINITGKWS